MGGRPGNKLHIIHGLLLRSLFKSPLKSSLEVIDNITINSITNNNSNSVLKGERYLNKLMEKNVKVILISFLQIIFFWGSTFGYQVKIDGVTKNFQYKRSVTIQGSQVPSAQSEFPMLFDSTVDSSLQNDLRHTGSGGKVQSTDGYDIVFATADGQEILKHEIEKYVSSTGEYIGWVKVDLTGSNQDIYLYYGINETPSDTQHVTAVWDSNYKGVWHLGEKYALDFDGSDDYIGIEKDLYNFNDSGFTVSAWINCEGLPTGNWELDRFLTDWGDDNNDWDISVERADSDIWGISFAIKGGGTTVTSTSGYSATPVFYNNWTHITAVWNTTDQILYVNGTEVDSDSNANMFTDLTMGIDVIGANPNGNYNFNGPIDEVRIWNRALSPTEVSDLYNGNPVSRTGLVGEWLMDEGTGDTVADSSGEGNDGDMTGHAATWVRPKAADSTENSNVGAREGSMAASVSGKISDADNFDGSDDYIRIEKDLYNFNDSGFTVSAWINCEGLPTGNWESDRFLTDWGDDDNDWDIYVERADSDIWGILLVIKGGGTTVASTSGYSATPVFYNNWTHITAVWNTTDQILYVNGTEVDSDSNANMFTDLTMGIDIIGANPNGNYNFNGPIDEVRISNTTRSGDWITTCYNNQNSPSSFYTIGEGQTFVELVSFTAKPLIFAVLLEWKTATEIDNEGFNVFRSEEEDRGYIQINHSFIPAKGLAGFGAEYSFTDYDVENAVTYYYILEDIDIYGKSNLHGPVSVTPNDIMLIWPTEWEPLSLDSPLFSWSGSGFSHYKVDISSSPDFVDSETLSFPLKGWASGQSLWLKPEEMKMILRKGRARRGKLLWRVRAKGENDHTICSSSRKFFVETHSSLKRNKREKKQSQKSKL